MDRWMDGWASRSTTIPHPIEAKPEPEQRGNEINIQFWYPSEQKEPRQEGEDLRNQILNCSP